MSRLARSREPVATRVRHIARDQRGIALVLALVALLALTALALSFLSVSAFEPQIAANLVGATQARYLAEAGVEAAFDGLARTPDWSSALAGATCVTGAIAPHTAAASTLPGLAAGSGSFTARVRNDCFPGTASVAGDRTLTGLGAEDGGGASADTNDRLVIVSTGRVGTASRTVTAVVRKVSLPPVPGALSFPGAGAHVDLAGSSLAISGIDTRMGADLAGDGAPVLGIAVGEAAAAAALKAALAGDTRQSISGRSDTAPPSRATGLHAVAHDPSLSSASVTRFVNALRRAADIAVSSTPAGPYAIHDVGASCPRSTGSPTCWGTPLQPKIVYVQGDGGGDGALRMSGDSSGTGILIVEDGSLELGGTFRWNGPVIVTGRGAGVRSPGGRAEERAIRGALVVNATAAPGAPGEAAVSGALTIAYSTEALRAVLDGLGGRRFMALYSWQEQ
jgi:Tfp pilus assembly protein PilX